MGQKVNPIGFRLGINKQWESNWYSKRDYRKFLKDDLTIRKYIKKELYYAGIAKIEIERMGSKIKINIYGARPGIIIGKKGLEVDKLKNKIQKMIPPENQLILNIKEVKSVETNAQLISENIALQIEKRVSYRRAMKKSVMTTLKAGALGIKICCSGRLAGAEIARREWYREGRLPLHTIRADIDYGFAMAKTTYGVIGVKVWVFMGEILASVKTNRIEKGNLTVSETKKNTGEKTHVIGA